MDDYNGKTKCGNDSWGMYGCTPFSLNGDKKTNSALGFEWGGGVKTGAEYRIHRRFGLVLEGLFRYSISYDEFQSDYHLWEDMEAYQDRHTEILLNRDIKDDAVFSVTPSMFGVSFGIVWYFKDRNLIGSP